MKHLLRKIRERFSSDFIVNGWRIYPLRDCQGRPNGKWAAYERRDDYLADDVAFYLKENNSRAEAIEFARQTPPHQARAKLLRGNWVIYDLRLGRITEVFDGRFVVTEHHWSN